MALWPFNQAKVELAAPIRSPSEAPDQPSIVHIGGDTAAAILTWNDSVAAETALRHPIVARAIDKIATSVSQARWFVEYDPYAAAEDRTGKKSMMKSLQSLLDSPNGEMTPSMLRYWMAQSYVCYGKVAVKIGFSAVDKSTANGIYPLEVAQVNAKRSATGSVDSYEYGSGANKQTFVGRLKWKPGDKGGFVDQIWKPSLKGYQDAGDRNSPLHSVGLPMQVTMALMRRAISSAEGHPNVRYMVTSSKSLTAPQLNALKKYLNQEHGPGGIQSGKIPVLQNAADVVIHKLDNDLSDIHSKVPLDDMSRMIFGAFGIPLALAGIGAADAAKFTGNFDGSRAAFWEDTIFPSYISPLFQGLTRMLCPAGVRISADVDSIPAMMPARIAGMQQLASVAFLTNDEKRELFGWEKSEVLLPGEPPTNPTAPTNPAA